MRMRNTLFGMIIVTTAMMTSGNAAAGNSPLDTKAASMSTADAAQLVAVGDLYLEAMRLDEAKASYKAALKLEAKYGDAEFGLARIDITRGKLEKAKKACRGVWRRHKDESVGEVCAGWLWLTFDRSARAMDEFQKAIAKGDTARGKTGMAEAHRRRADDGIAIVEYQEALTAGAGYVARMGLGLSQESNGDTTAALASLKQATTLEPASCLAHFHYARILGKGAQAVSHMQTAIAIRPNWTEAYVELGEILLENVDFAGAKSAFESAISTAKVKSGIAHLGLGKALFGLKKPADSKKQLEAAVELVPNLVDAYLLLADIEYANGNSEASLEALDKAKAMAPGVVRVYLHTGETYFRLGRYTSANSYLKQAINLKPALSLAHMYLGDIACERRLYAAGQTHYDNALKGDMVGLSADSIKKRKAVCKSKHP